MRLKGAANNCRAHRWVVDVGVACEQNHVDVIPSQVLNLFLGCWQPLFLDFHIVIGFVLRWQRNRLDFIIAFENLVFLVVSGSRRGHLRKS